MTKPKTVMEILVAGWRGLPLPLVDELERYRRVLRLLCPRCAEKVENDVPRCMYICTKCGHGYTWEYRDAVRASASTAPGILP